MQSGCVSSHSLVINDMECSPHCWRKIQPGSTTKNELLTILGKMSDLQNGSKFERSETWNNYVYDVIGFELINKETTEVYILNDKVIFIYFDNIENVSFQDVVQRYGEPKYILNFQDLGKSFPYIGESLHTLIVGLSPEKGVSYGYDANRGIGIFNKDIQPRTSIGWIGYFDPSSYPDLLATGMFSDGIPKSQNDFHPWQGYGDIETKYP
jgi:hypothetical protein